MKKAFDRAQKALNKANGLIYEIHADIDDINHDCDGDICAAAYDLVEEAKAYAFAAEHATSFSGHPDASECDQERAADRAEFAAHLAIMAITHAKTEAEESARQWKADNSSS